MSAYEGYHKPTPWQYQVFDKHNVRFTNIPLWEQKQLERSMPSRDDGKPEEKENDGGSEPEAQEEGASPESAVDLAGGTKQSDGGEAEAVDGTHSDIAEESEGRGDAEAPSEPADIVTTEADAEPVELASGDVSSGPHDTSEEEARADEKVAVSFITSGGTPHLTNCQGCDKS